MPAAPAAAWPANRSVPGLVLDFSKFLRRIVRIEADTVRVQPGMVHERLNAQLRLRGRLFGPDPANSAVTTIGSMIALDASGSRWLKYGSVRRHVRSLQVVLADGQLMELDRAPLVDGASEDPLPRKRDLVNRLAALLTEQAEVIRAHQPKGPLRRCGYNLADVLTADHLDLAGLLAGSEGTLALITEATLATQPLPRHRGVALLLFESLEKASRAAGEILPPGPSACDLMDRRHLSLAREGEIRFDLLIPRGDRGPAAGRIRGRRSAARSATRCTGWSTTSASSSGWPSAPGRPSTRRRPTSSGGWPTRRQPLLYRVKGPSRPVPVVEDVAVPPEMLAAFLVRMQNVLKRQPDHRLAAVPRRPGATAHPALPGPRRPGRRAADAADGRGTLPGSVRRRRHDQRRTCLRPEPHALSRPPGRPALRRPPPR